VVDRPIPSQEITSGRSNAAAIELIDVRKDFVTPSGSVRLVLDGISVRLDRSQFTVFVGPSGCGKSTLLQIAVGLMAPTSGEVRCFGERMESLRSDIGYITQQANLFPWYTVRQNVELPLILRSVSARDRQERVDYFLGVAGLTGFEEHYPHQLSGGMQKRASIIRTLIYAPPIVLMDEPFASLDAQTRMIMQDHLLAMWSELRMTVLFVTHDLQEAVVLADNVVLLTGQPTKVKGNCVVELERPRNVFEPYSMSGFVATYDRVWNMFKSEIHHG
jgi:NitT/TauT family transport system ATP-binding protein